jgi:transcriptional adapter 2-alpha
MYHCDYCRKDISGGIRIKCSVCVDFDLCVECFSVGVEVTPHANDHAYQVMDRVNFPLFDEEWEAEEELLLLEAIAKYGLGNWEDVADHVGTKQLHECREHYFAVYIDPPTGPLPDTAHTLTSAATLQARKREADERAQSAARKKRNKKVVRDTNAVQESSKTLPGQRPASPPVGVPGGAASSAAAGNAAYASAPVSLDLAGFMPLRHEFETEFFNDAEEIISPLTFDDDDTSEEREAKFRLLELYNRKLAERYARRGFVIDRQLMHVKKLLAREKDLEREDRDTYGRLRVFMQVLSRTDFDTFVDGILAERRYRRRIEQMQRLAPGRLPHRQRRRALRRRRQAPRRRGRRAQALRGRADRRHGRARRRAPPQARPAQQVEQQSAQGQEDDAAAARRPARHAAAHDARGRTVLGEPHLSEAVSARQEHAAASQSAARTARAATHEAARVARRLTRHAGVSIFGDGWMAAQSRSIVAAQTRSIATNRRCGGSSESGR